MLRCHSHSHPILLASKSVGHSYNLLIVCSASEAFLPQSLPSNRRRDTASALSLPALSPFVTCRLHKIISSLHFLMRIRGMTTTTTTPMPMPTPRRWQRPEQAMEWEQEPTRSITRSVLLVTIHADLQSMPKLLHGHPAELRCALQSVSRYSCSTTRTRTRIVAPHLFVSVRPSDRLRTRNRPRPSSPAQSYSSMPMPPMRRPSYLGGNLDLASAPTKPHAAVQ
jgi:hypothetical protein